MKFGMIAATVIAMGGLCAGAGIAAAPANPPGGNIYDWPQIGQGMWAPIMVGFGNGKRVAFPLNAKAKAASDAANKKVSALASCDPVGPVGLIGAGYPLKFYFTPGQIVMMTDMDALWVRHIYMDGKPHHDYGPTYEGYSTGHWEGQTLVIDTKDLLSKTKITSGVPASPTTRLEERYTLISPNKISLKFTIYDPATMTAPYIKEQAYVRHADWEIEDTFCGEDNRDAPNANGGDSVNLTPPAT